jgi:hypothetical protein
MSFGKWTDELYCCVEGWEGDTVQAEFDRRIADEREKIAANAPTDLEWTEGDTPSEDGWYLVETNTDFPDTVKCVDGAFSLVGPMSHATILRYAKINAYKGEGSNVHMGEE